MVSVQYSIKYLIEYWSSKLLDSVSPNRNIYRNRRCSGCYDNCNLLQCDYVIRDFAKYLVVYRCGAQTETTALASHIRHVSTHFNRPATVS